MIMTLLANVRIPVVVTMLDRDFHKYDDDGLPNNILSRTFAIGGCSLRLPAVLKAPHCNLLVWGRAAGRGGRLLLLP